MKVYCGIICTYYECGDESGNSDYTVGIYDDPQKAYDAAIEHLKKNYEYFEEDNRTYYSGCSGFADEAWEEVWEYELNTTSEECGRMAKDENGNWYNETKKIEEEMKSATYTPPIMQRCE